MNVKKHKLKKLYCSVLLALFFAHAHTPFVYAAPMDASFLQPADDAEVKDLLTEAIQSGAVPSVTVKIYHLLPSVTRYERDLIIASTLYSAYTGRDKLSDAQKGILQKLVKNDTARRAILNVYGDNQLIDAITALQKKEQPLQSPPVPKIPNTNFSRAFTPPTLPPAPTEEKKAPPPPAPPPDPVPPITPLSDVGIFEAANLKTIKEMEEDRMQAAPGKDKRNLFDFLFEHKFAYRHTRATGATIYDTENDLDGYGNPTKAKYKNEYSMQQELIFKTILNASESTRIALGLRAYDPTGVIGRKSSSYTFDNVVANIKKIHTFTFGRFSESYGGYSVDLDNIKGIKYQYNGNDNALSMMSGKSGELNDEIYNDGPAKKIWGIQYLTKKFVKNFNLALSYAKGEEVADQRMKQHIASFSFSGKTGADNPLEVSGEMNFGQTVTKDAKHDAAGNLLSMDYANSKMKAFYLDAAKSFGRLAATLHVVNISPDYAGLVKDISGDGSSRSPDGKTDYPYGAGQRGYDIALGYKIDENTLLQAGYSHYPQTENKEKNLVKTYIAAAHVQRITNNNEQTGQVDVALRYEKNGVNGVSGAKVSGELNTALLLAKDTSLALGFLFSSGDDGSSGNERRFVADFAKKWEVAKRVVLAANANYEKKMRDDTQLTETPYSAATDSSKVSGSVGLTYETIPGILNTSIVYTRSKSNVVNPEYALETGQNLDGQSENRSSLMLGVDWHYKGIPGLTLTAGIGKDNVHYYDSDLDSKQNVLTGGIEYKRKINADSSATVKYEMTKRADPQHPQYNEIYHEIGADLNINIDKDSNLSINHTEQKIIKASDPNGSSNVTQTTVEVVNKF